MPFEVGETINFFADKFTKFPIVHKIAHNPIYTAILITFIVCCVILFVFKDAETDESLFTMTLRCGFWTALSTVAILFVFNKSTADERLGAVKQGEVDKLFTGLGGGADEAFVPVLINTNFDL